MTGRLCAVTVLLTFALGAGLPGQNLRNADQPSADIPADCEDAVRNLVDRYEELRVLLREQIELNASLYSESEMEKMMQELRAQVGALEEEISFLTAEYKRAVQVAKEAEEDALAFKSHMNKNRVALTEEADTLRSIIDNVEEERLFTIGGGFSQSGYLNAMGMFNLPGTNLSIFGQGNYEFRTQSNFVSFGVAFQLVPQRAVVETWERFRRRMNRRNRAKDEAMENTEAKATEQSASNGPIQDDMPVIP